MLITHKQTEMNSQTKSFHNTVEASGQLLIIYENNAKAQEAKILDYLTDLPTMSFTTLELHEKLFSCTKVPESSLRRACTNLATDKHDKKTGELIRKALIKVNGKKEGIYGININAYKVI